jgi:hypothetical protein
MDPADPKTVHRVVLACVQCRSRHVKCDAAQPSCSRCQRDGKECTYHKSRRGGLDKAALARRRMRLLEEEQARSGDSTRQNTSPEASNIIGEMEFISIQHTHEPDMSSSHIVEPQLSAANSIAFHISNDRLLDMFYEGFWHGFPFPLPKHYLSQRQLQENHGLENLLPVMHWIGSIYAPWASSEPYYEIAHQMLESTALPRNPWSVQALMLAAIAEQHSDLRAQSRKSLDQAIALAVDLRMNTKEFAQIHGESQVILEESWRRTYYFLVLLDRHFAVVANTPIHALQDIPNLVDLPCDDEVYELGVSLNQW